MAIYWYNVSPKEKMLESSVPATQLFPYKWKCLIMDRTPTADEKNSFCYLSLGQQVFVKPTEHSCSKQWKVGTVTKEQQRQSFEVDGVVFKSTNPQQNNLKYMRGRNYLAM